MAASTPPFFPFGPRSLVKLMRQSAAELSAALEADSSKIDDVIKDGIGMGLGECTLLVLAAREANCEAVKVLVRHGADIRCTSSTQVDTVVGWLCWHDGKDVADALDAVLSEWVSRYGEEEVKTLINTPRHLGYYLRYLSTRSLADVQD